MDPISLLLIAQTAFAALKSGIATGKELQGMAKDLGSLFDAVAHITRIAADPKSDLLAGKSAQQIAMEAYAAREEANAMMEELKNTFISEYGIAAWDQVVSATTQIKKQQKADALQAAKEQEELVNSIAEYALIAVGVIITISIVVVSIMLVLQR